MHRKTKLFISFGIVLCLFFIIIPPQPVEGTTPTTTKIIDYDFSALSLVTNISQDNTASILNFTYGYWDGYNTRPPTTPPSGWTEDYHGLAGFNYASAGSRWEVVEGVDWFRTMSIYPADTSGENASLYRDFTGLNTTLVDGFNNAWFIAPINSDNTTAFLSFYQLEFYDQADVLLGQIQFYLNESDDAIEDALTDYYYMGDRSTLEGEGAWVCIIQNVTSYFTDDSNGVTVNEMDDIYKMRVRGGAIVNPSGGASPQATIDLDSSMFISKEGIDLPEIIRDIGTPRDCHYSPLGLHMYSGISTQQCKIFEDHTEFDDINDYQVNVTYASITGSPEIWANVSIDDGAWGNWTEQMSSFTNKTFVSYRTLESYTGNDISGTSFTLICQGSSTDQIVLLGLEVQIISIPSGNGGNGGGGGDGTGDGGGGDGDGNGGVSESLKMVVETNKKNYYWGDFIYVDVYLIYAKDVSSEYVRVAFDDYEFEYAEKIEDKHYQIVFDTTLYVSEYGEHIIYIEAKTNVHNLVSDTVTVNVVQFLGPTEAIENWLYAGGSLVNAIYIVLLSGIAIISLVFGRFYNIYLRALVTLIVGTITGFFGWIAYYFQVEFIPSFLTFGDVISNFMWFFGLIIFGLTMYTLLKRRREEKHSGILT